MDKKLGKRHNKKRNTALLYEFLIKHVSHCVVNENKDEVDKTLSILKKYFSKGMPLFEDLKLFKTILNTTVKSRESAHKILDNICESASKYNVRDLDLQKSKLIKEINYAYKDKSVYNYKIPHYTVCASVQTLLNNVRNKKKYLTTIEKVQLEDKVTDFLLLEKINKPAPLKKNPIYNNTVYKLIVNKFHEKYFDKLNENQRNFLMKYSTYLITEDKEHFKKEILIETKNIKQDLKNIKDKEIVEDEDLMKKINECYENFMVKDFDDVSEENVLVVLQYMQLLNEVNS
jgi:hypothetical protein